MKKALAMTVLLAPLTLSCQAQPERPLFTPAPGSPWPVGAEPADVVVGDFDGDGLLDLATANTGSNTVSVLLGQ